MRLLTALCLAALVCGCATSEPPPPHHYPEPQPIAQPAPEPEPERVEVIKKETTEEVIKEGTVVE